MLPLDSARNSGCKFQSGSHLIFCKTRKWCIAFETETVCLDQTLLDTGLGPEEAEFEIVFKTKAKDTHEYLARRPFRMYGTAAFESKQKFEENILS